MINRKDRLKRIIKTQRMFKLIKIRGILKKYGFRRVDPTELNGLRNPMYEYLIP